MLKERPKPPEGCNLIDVGKVRRSDWVWDVYEKKWCHPSNYDYQALGTDVKDYYAVAR